MAGSSFPVNAHRYDPYSNFKFVVKWDTDVVAGVCKMSALKRTTEVIKHREGGDTSTSRKAPGRTEYEPITLERGVTHDPAFEEWANLGWTRGNAPGREVSLATYRKNIQIEVRNEAGEAVIRYNVYRCWVSEFQALPDFDANGNAVAIQHLKLENEGWARDTSLKETMEPTLAATANGQ